MIGDGAAGFAHAHHRGDFRKIGMLEAGNARAVERKLAQNRALTLRLHARLVLRVVRVVEVEEFRTVEGNRVAPSGHGEELPVQRVLARELPLVNRLKEQRLQRPVLPGVQRHGAVVVFGTRARRVVRMRHPLKVIPERLRVHPAQQVAERHRLIFAVLLAAVQRFKAQRVHNVGVAGRVDEDFARDLAPPGLVHDFNRCNLPALAPCADEERVVQNPYAALHKHFVEHDFEHLRVEPAVALSRGRAEREHAAVDLAGHIAAHRVAGNAGVHQRRNERKRAAAARRAKLFNDQHVAPRVRGGNGGDRTGGSRAADDDFRFISHQKRPPSHHSRQNYPTEIICGIPPTRVARLSGGTAQTR